MSRRHFLELNMLVSHMTRAIRIGYAEGVDLLLQSVEKIPPNVLGVLAHHTLNAPRYEILTDFKTSGHNFEREFVPKSANEYELNLRQIVELMAKRGANFSIPDSEGSVAAQRAFNNVSASDAARKPTCFALVAQTLIQNPNWLPDISEPFRKLDCLPEDHDAKERRALAEDHVGTLGLEIKLWLTDRHMNSTPSLTPLALAMSPIVRSFWLRDSWRLEEAEMPWGHPKTIASNRALAVQEAAHNAVPMNQALAAIARAKAQP